MQEFIGLLIVDIIIPGALSLKDKRMVVKSIKDKIRGKFNVSIAETDYQEKWQRGRIAIAQVGSDYGYIEQNLNNIFRMMDEIPEFEIVNHTFEFL